MIGPESGGTARRPTTMAKVEAASAVRGCPVCGGAMFGWVNARAADPGDRRHFVVDACADCGLGLLRDPDPRSATELHSAGSYASSRPRLAGLARPLLSLFDRAKLQLLRPALPQGGRVVEVGAGRGRFVARLSASGYEASGIEPAAHRQAEAAELGADVEVAAIDDAEVAPASLDGVVAWHVLEHLDDPAAALDRIQDWLKPGGALLIGVPNRAGWQAGIGGEHWFHLDLPRHRWHFTPRSLETLLATAGFEVRRVRHVLAEQNQFGMWQTVMNGITFHDNVLFGLLKRSLGPRTADSRWKLGFDVLVTLLAGPLALVVTAPLELAAGAFRRGGTIAVLAVSARDRSD